MSSFLPAMPTFVNPITALQNFLFNVLELIGPGQILTFPKEGDNYQGKESVSDRIPGWR